MADKNIKQQAMVTGAWKDWAGDSIGITLGERKMYTFLREEIFNLHIRSNPGFLSNKNYERVINIVRNHEW